MSNRGGRRRPQGGRGGSSGGMAVDEPAPAQAVKVPHVEIRHWEGGSMEDVVGFVQRKSRVDLSNPRCNGAIVSAQIPSGRTKAVEGVNGMKFAGQILDVRVVYKAASGQSPTTSLAIQILQSFLNSHYNKDAKLLNFTNMMSDPTLIQYNLLSNVSTAMKMFRALMKLAQENFGAIESISLEGNNLADCQLPLIVAEFYPELRNLSLANNQILSVGSFAPLMRKFPMLRELVLAGNPIQQEPTFQSAVGELLSMFPRLQILDGVTVRTEADVPPEPRLLPIKPAFFEDDGVASLAPMFLTNFFSLWDTNRQALLSLYDQASLFSLCFTSAPPYRRNQKSTEYIAHSRNLMRNSSTNVRYSKIQLGGSAIMAAFQKLPKSKHDLTKPGAFAIDAWKVTDVRGPGDTAIMMVVHGEFAEQPNSLIRSFDRTLVVLPGINNSFVIASDMLNVRPHSALPISPDTPPSQPHTPSPAPIPSAEPGLNQPPVAGGPAPVAANQASLVQELMRQTGLTAEFAEMCLKQANFDLNTAFSTVSAIACAATAERVPMILYRYGNK